MEKKAYNKPIGTGMATLCKGHLTAKDMPKKTSSCSCLKSLYCGNMCFRNEEETKCKKSKRISDMKRCNYLSESRCR